MTLESRYNHFLRLPKYPFFPFLLKEPFVLALYKPTCRIIIPLWCNYQAVTFRFIVGLVYV